MFTMCTSNCWISFFWFGHSFEQKQLSPDQLSAHDSCIQTASGFASGSNRGLIYSLFMLFSWWLKIFSFKNLSECCMIWIQQDKLRNCFHTVLDWKWLRVSLTASCYCCCYTLTRTHTTHHWVITVQSAGRGAHSASGELTLHKQLNTPEENSVFVA